MAQSINQSTLNKLAVAPVIETKKIFSLKTIILSFTMMASIVPLSIYGYVSYSEITQKTEASVNGTLLNSNKANAQVVKVWVESKEKTMKAIAESDSIKNMDLVESKAFLTRANGKNPEYYTMNLHDLTGQQVARSTDDKLINIADRGYFKNIVKEGKDTHIESAISRANGKGFIAFAVEVRSQTKELVGMLAGLSTIDNVTESVTGKKIGETGISYLVDSTTKKILAHPDSKIVGQDLTDKDVEKISKEKFDIVSDGLNTEKKAVKYTSNPIGNNFVLVSEIDADEINGPIMADQKKFFGFITVAILFAAFLSFALAKSITNKINKLSQLATEVSRAKSVNQITEIESKIKEVGGAREIQSIGQALVRLTTSIKIAMRSL